MNSTPMRSGKDPDEDLYIMDSCHDRLNATHQRVRQTDNTNTSYSKLFHRNTRPFAMLTWRGEISALPTFDV